MAARAPQEPLLEWIAGIVGLVMVIGSVAYLLYLGIERKESLPDLHVAVTGIRPQAGGYLVTFTAENRGDSTAQGVKIVGRLQLGDGEQTSEVTLDYVPATSRRQGGLFFTEDPRRHPLRIRAEGYSRP